MPELIADLPAVAILLPAASVYFLWALFHWIFRPGDDQLIDETQELHEHSETHTADFSASTPGIAQSDRSNNDVYASATSSSQDGAYDATARHAIQSDQSAVPLNASFTASSHVSSSPATSPSAKGHHDSETLEPSSPADTGISTPPRISGIADNQPSIASDNPDKHVNEHAEDLSNSALHSAEAPAVTGAHTDAPGAKHNTLSDEDSCCGVKNDSPATTIVDDLPEPRHSNTQQTNADQATETAGGDLNIAVKATHLDQTDGQSQSASTESVTATTDHSFTATAATSDKQSNASGKSKSIGGSVTVESRNGSDPEGKSDTARSAAETPGPNSASDKEHAASLTLVPDQAAKAADSPPGLTHGRRGALHLSISSEKTARDSLRGETHTLVLSDSDDDSDKVRSKQLPGTLERFHTEPDSARDAAKNGAARQTEHEATAKAEQDTTADSNDIAARIEQDAATQPASGASPIHIQPGLKKPSTSIITDRKPGPDTPPPVPEKYRTAARRKSLSPVDEVQLQLKTLDDTHWRAQYDAANQAQKKAHAAQITAKDDEIAQLKQKLQALEDERNTTTEEADESTEQADTKAIEARYQNALVELAGSARKIRRLQSAVNTLQATTATTGDTAPKANPASHPRASLLSKVRVVSNG